MSELTLNDDGTITFPLRPVTGADGPKDRNVLLPEPSMRQLAQIHIIVNQADEKLPPVLPIGDPKNATADQLTAATERLNQRTMQAYSDDPPYGNAVVAIIKLLTDKEYSLEDLPGWAANPQVCRSILTHFQTPLVG